jgi:hypothetical protein
MKSNMTEGIGRRVRHTYVAQFKAKHAKRLQALCSAFIYVCLNHLTVKAR